MHPGRNGTRARSCPAWVACRRDLQCYSSRRHGRVGLEQGGCEVQTDPGLYPNGHRCSCNGLCWGGMKRNHMWRKWGAGSGQRVTLKRFQSSSLHLYIDLPVITCSQSVIIPDCNQTFVNLWIYGNDHFIYLLLLW